MLDRLKLIRSKAATGKVIDNEQPFDLKMTEIAIYFVLAINFHDKREAGWRSVTYIMSELDHWIHLHGLHVDTRYHKLDISANKIMYPSELDTSTSQVMNKLMMLMMIVMEVEVESSRDKRRKQNKSNWNFFFLTFSSSLCTETKTNFNHETNMKVFVSFRFLDSQLSISTFCDNLFHLSMQFYFIFSFSLELFFHLSDFYFFFLCNSFPLCEKKQVEIVVENSKMMWAEESRRGWILMQTFLFHNLN